MAKRKSKTMMWVGLLAALGIGGYVWYKKNQALAAVAPTPTVGPGIIPALPPTIPVTAIPPAPSAPAAGLPPPNVANVVPVPAAPSPVISTPLNMPATPTQPYSIPYDPRMDTLQSWAESSMNAGNLAQWNTSKGQFTPAEWAGLFDLYFNDWQAGQGNTAARTAFWDSWRVKYHILDGTY